MILTEFYEVSPHFRRPKLIKVSAVDCALAKGVRICIGGIVYHILTVTIDLDQDKRMVRMTEIKE